ncbi:hypothetical protein [Pseudomonas sp. KK4]|uniref:hypothetical protein n=1 Tax=Pseudomonas sp. KK4 TaxID=1855729 RepID=UPI0015898DEB|nr:hypothetical protein [Pseudomonas sp. KK4]
MNADPDDKKPDPGKYDPLTTPDPDDPQEWDESAEREMPEADEQTPLSDDRR